MKFAIFGSGSVGGFLGSRLLEGGHEVHFIARGPSLDALRSRGLIVQSTVFGDHHYDVQASASTEEVGPCDYVLLTVKAHALTEVAPRVGPLKGPQTVFVSTQNGIPWWYSFDTQAADDPIEVVDPGGVIERHIPSENVISSIVYFSCSMNGPATVEHSGGIRLPLGEPSGRRSERALKLSGALHAVGIKAPVRHNIRHELWVKLLGNAVFNPLSAITQATILELIESPAGLRLIRDAMAEIREVAAAVGIPIAISTQRRIEGARSVGHHRTSMLQDLDQGREPEIEALVGAILELADRNHVEVPILRALYATTRILFASRASARSRGLEPNS